MNWRPGAWKEQLPAWSLKPQAWAPDVPVAGKTADGTILHFPDDLLRRLKEAAKAAPRETGPARGRFRLADHPQLWALVDRERSHGWNL